MKKKCNYIIVFMIIFLSFSLKVKASNYKICIDYPKENSVYNDKMYVQGWVMTDIKDTYVTISIDNKEISEEITRTKRDDVIKVINGYGDSDTNPTPGFNTYIDLSNISSGNHIISVSVYTKENKLVGSLSRSFNANETLVKSVIDYPRDSSTYGDKIIIQGWVMSTTPSLETKVFVDNSLVEINLNRYERPDVLKVIQGYGDSITNPTPGFRGEIPTTNLEDGTHTIRIDYLKNNNTVSSVEKKFIIKRNYSKVKLDYPRDTIKGSLLSIRGWLMSTNSDVSLKFYIDNNIINVNYSHYERPDVLQVIHGFGDISNNPLPGFAGTLPIDNIKDGNHKIKVEVISSENKVIATDSRDFILKKYESSIRLDTPRNNITIQGTNLVLQGWSMSEDREAKLHLYVDNNEITSEITRYERPDVLKVFPNSYGGKELNQQPGYISNVDVSNYKDGKHTVKVTLVSPKTEEILSEITREIYFKKYESSIRLDTPRNNMTIQGTNLVLQGWSMSEDREAKLHLYVDNNEITSEITRYDRPDVLKVFPNSYGGKELNQQPGYISTVDISNYKDGKHTVKVTLVSSKTEEILSEITREIYFKKYESSIRIDTPRNNITIQGTNLVLQGWSMSEDREAKLHLYVDNNEVTSEITRYDRPDVLKVFPNSYGGKESNPLPGYTSSIDVSNYKDGKHTVKVTLVSPKTEEILGEITREIYLKKYDGTIYIDFPTKSNFSNESVITIQGWYLSDFQNSTIKVLIDNTELPVNRYDRPDVLEVYPTSFGGRETNQLPGYTTTYSLSNLRPGEHTIKILVYDNLDDIITSVSRKILIYDKIYFGIDVSSHQKRINWDMVSKTGIDFAILRIGYGDNWISQDDTQFINNVNGVTKNKIPFGVYIYSYATNLNGASGLNQDSASIDSEISHTLRLLNSLSREQKENFKLPVFLDMEDDSTKHIGKSRLTLFADYYCSTLEKNGYKCGVYANKNWLTNYLDSKYLVNKYDIWLAHYTNGYYDNSDYNGEYHIWQYSSTGQLNGIDTLGLDMDISYKKYW